MPELFKTGEDIAEELKAQTVEPNTATDLLLNGDSKPHRFSTQCAENEEPDADLTENLLHDEKSNKNTITGTNTPRSSRASAYYDLLRSQHKDGHYMERQHISRSYMGYLICHHSGSLPCRYVGIPTAVVSGLSLNMAFSIYLPYRFSAIYFSAMWTATAPSATAVTT